ncbi:MAG: hypothetical protein QOG67_951 [Verrucomicrobiota bacterium]|jgi:Gpi18-like mannosyltransferase
MQPALPTLEADNASYVLRGGEQNAPRNNFSILLIGAALVALLVKLTISYNTFGTNDAVSFYLFARSLSDHGLEWTYRQGVVWLPSGPIFNHPPITAGFLRLIYHLSNQDVFRTFGLTFPFLLRLPGILADFVVVLVLVSWLRAHEQLHRYRWALLLLALSPVSLMVAGFHGNTDPVMVMCLVLAAWMCSKKQPGLCGLFLALSCQVKIIPLLFFPVFFFFWLHRRAVASFLVPFFLTSIVLWSEPLLRFPLLFFKNVLSYSSYWGIWGFTYWLRLTDLPYFSGVRIFGLTTPQAFVVTFLKALIVGGVLLIAWRRRTCSGRGLFETIAYGWVIFFIFSPGICAQYMVWLAPFVCILSPTFYAWLTVTSSLFLFFFYNVTAHGLPWYLAVSTNALNTVWTPWSVLPWAALIAGMIVLWKNARKVDPTLRLFSLTTVKAE